MNRYYKLNVSQVKKLNQYIEKPADYGLVLKQDCAEWASDAIRYVVSETLESRDWIIFHTPDRLAISIAFAEYANPTSSLKPIDVSNNKQTSTSSFGK